MIEVKNGLRTFDLNHWRENQRLWASRFCVAPPFATPYWIWLAIGLDPPNRNPQNHEPRKTWLLPCGKLLQVEARLKPIQNTLVYRAGKGHKREIQDLSLDAVTLLRDYELSWAGKGAWTIPPAHQFRRDFISPAPLHPYLIPKAEQINT